ncbi:MAG: sigma-70 family RNA polymerase sigma factor [Solirubrobacteraceae bacterium]
MSPLHLRRYRAERLLRSQFEELRAGVLRAVRARLGSVALDEADLEACYSQAWQGLYAAIIGGEEIENPAGWLILVTYRRAIDEQRTRRHAGQLHPDAAVADPDFAAELDDRLKLRRLIEGLSVDLSERERQAAALCYLQGLTREQAARRMGIAPKRMQKLMEGRGDGRPGVAAKVGALTRSISEGRFCEEHASLMRAFAFGVLDPEGERHQIALAHRRNCPACRAYVLSLRGLSAVLPPVFLPGLLGGLELGGGGAGGAAHAMKAAGRLRGIGGRVAGSGASGVKIAAAGLVLLGGGAAGVAITATFSGAHSHPAHRDVLGSNTAPASRAEALPRSGRESKRRQASPRHDARHGSAGQSRNDASSLPPAVREFGIERSPRISTGTPLAGPAPAASQAQREFGIE